MANIILVIGILASLMALTLVRHGSLIKDRISYKKAWLNLCLSVALDAAMAVIRGIISLVGGKSGDLQAAIADGTSVLSILTSVASYLLVALSLWYLSKACYGDDETEIHEAD